MKRDDLVRQFGAAVVDAMQELVHHEVTLAVDAAIAERIGTLESGERLLTIPAAAERAGVSETTLRRWLRASPPLVKTVPLPGRTDSTERRIRQADLDAAIRSLAGAPARKESTPRSRATSSTRQPVSLSKAVTDRAVRRGVIPSSKKKARLSSH